MWNKYSILKQKILAPANSLEYTTYQNNAGSNNTKLKTSTTLTTFGFHAFPRRSKLTQARTQVFFYQTRMRKFLRCPKIDASDVYRLQVSRTNFSFKMLSTLDRAKIVTYTNEVSRLIDSCMWS